MRCPLRLAMSIPNINKHLIPAFVKAIIEASNEKDKGPPIMDILLKHFEAINNVGKLKCSSTLGFNYPTSGAGIKYLVRWGRYDSMYIHTGKVVPARSQQCLPVAPERYT